MFQASSTGVLWLTHVCQNASCSKKVHQKIDKLDWLSPYTRETRQNASNWYPQRRQVWIIQQIFLTLWQPVYEYIVPGFRPKTSSFWLPYQRHSTSADCAIELLKGSNRSASLLVYTRKKIFWLAVADFLWVTS